MAGIGIGLHSSSIYIANYFKTAEFKVRLYSVGLAMVCVNYTQHLAQHALLGGQGHAPRKILKICTPKIETRSNFDGTS